ncbi:MAG: hypothetical protein GX811_13420 [Lentisphaerae bacterium]|nr:hypothetical protein [Lentisphaerota bacterium]
MLLFHEKCFEKKDVGHRFTQRPYFPMLLGNGTDAILISCFGTPFPVSDSSLFLPGNYNKSIGWHKTDRKNFKSKTSYGANLILAEVETNFFIGTEIFRPKQTKQYFDPITAVLTTEFEKSSHRDTGLIKLKISTFLTGSHTLVEHYEVLKAPETPFSLEFRLKPAFDAGSCSIDPRIHASDVAYSDMQNKEGFCFTYNLETYSGIAANWFELNNYHNIESWQRATQETIRSPGLKTGDSLTRYTAILDNEDSENYKKALFKIVELTKSVRYKNILNSHADYWAKRQSASSVQLPDPELQYQYNLSQYVIRSVFDMTTGFLPMGILPYQWQNCMFWDSWFCSMAWLGSNRSEYSKRLSEFWLSALPQAKELAAKIGSPGARFNWTLTRKAPTRNAERIIQFHNNGVVIIQISQTWRATGDKQFLGKVFPVMENALMFLVEHLVGHDENGVYIGQCAGPDESTTDRKRNDTWTTAVMLDGIDRYLEAARALDKKTFRTDLQKLRQELQTILHRNVDGEGVLQSFEGGTRPHWGSIIFSLFPDHPALAKTVERISLYDEELDCYDSLGVVSSYCRNFTWAELRIIRILGEQGDPAGWIRLKKNAKFTNSLGGIPEQIVCTGQPVNEWFMTSHAAYIWALHALLIRRHGEQLNVFNCLPENWQDLSVQNLTTEDGLCVSATLTSGTCTKLEITNMHTETRRILINAPGISEQNLVIESGHTVKVV